MYSCVVTFLSMNISRLYNKYLPRNGDEIGKGTVQGLGTSHHASAHAWTASFSTIHTGYLYS
jgi:hypothetical protein